MYKKKKVVTVYIQDTCIFIYIYVYLSQINCCVVKMMFYVLGNYLFCVSLFSEERYEYAKKLKNTIQELQKVNH